MRQYVIIIGLVVAALAGSLLTSCQTDDEQPEMLRLPIVLAIPASEGTDTRALGDPGTFEPFELPRYLYLYVVATNANGERVLLRLSNDSFMTELNPDAWEKVANTAGGYPTESDSLYRYTEGVAVDIPEEIDRTQEAVVYAAVSRERLDESLDSQPTAATVLDAGFTVAEKADGYTYLRDIYSTPYNLGKNGIQTTATNAYYGTVTNFASNVPVVNLMLYHVAAKIDVTWNVNADRQPGLKVEELQLARLFNHTYGQKAYLFRPTENKVSAPTGHEGYNVSLCAEGDVGKQYYGRGYTYAIACKNNEGRYFVHMKARKAGATQYYQPMFTMESASNLFAPWMRINLRLDDLPTSQAEGVEVRL